MLSILKSFETQIKQLKAEEPLFDKYKMRDIEGKAIEFESIFKDTADTKY
jgi:hypothetical protein